MYSYILTFINIYRIKMQQILCILILWNFYQISNLDFVSVKIMCSKQSVNIRDLLDLTI